MSLPVTKHLQTQLLPQLTMKSTAFAGGHINPAVSLGFFIAGRISFLRGLLYTICQVLGAAVGAALIRAVRPHLPVHTSFLRAHHKCNWVHHTLLHDFNWYCTAQDAPWSTTRATAMYLVKKTGLHARHSYNH